MRELFVRTVIVLITASTVLGAGEGAPAESPDLHTQMNQLLERVAAQDRKIAAQDAALATLRNQQNETWLNQRRAEEVKELIREVLSDADTRSSLIGEGHTAGFKGNHFYLISEDQNFLLEVGGMVQFRYIFSTSDNSYDGASMTDLDDDRGGFEMRRARFTFKGHVFDPSIQYFLLFQISRSNGDAVLLNGWVKKTYGEHWAVWAGQDKMQVWREWLAPAAVQPFVERSLVAAEFCGVYTQGLFGSYSDDRLRAVLSINDGELDLNGMWEKEDIEGVGISARTEYLVSGTWGQYGDFTAWPADEPLLGVAAGIHYQQGEYGTTTDEASLLRWTVDAVAKYKNFALFVAFLGNHIAGSDTIPDMDQYGVLVQGGVMLTEDIELVARYEWGDIDIDSIDDLSVLTIGFTKYWHKHNLKWTTDVGYAFNPIENASVGGQTFGWASDSSGWRADADDADGQIVFRSKIQLVF